MGSFLEAVVNNDLKRACEKADLHNRYRIFDVVSFLYNEAPVASWGTEERVARWHKNGGLKGLREATPTEADVLIDFATKQMYNTIQEDRKSKGLCPSCGHSPHDEPCRAMVWGDGIEEACGCEALVLLG